MTDPELGLGDIARAAAGTAWDLALIGVEHTLAWVETKAREWRERVAGMSFQP